MAGSFGSWRLRRGSCESVPPCKAMKQAVVTRDWFRVVVDLPICEHACAVAYTRNNLASTRLVNFLQFLFVSLQSVVVHRHSGLSFQYPRRLEEHSSYPVQAHASCKDG